MQCSVDMLIATFYLCAIMCIRDAARARPCMHYLHLFPGHLGGRAITGVKCVHGVCIMVLGGKTIP